MSELVKFQNTSSSISLDTSLLDKKLSEVDTKITSLEQKKDATAAEQEIVVLKSALNTLLDKVLLLENSHKELLARVSLLESSKDISKNVIQNVIPSVNEPVKAEPIELEKPHPVVLPTAAPKEQPKPVITEAQKVECIICHQKVLASTLFEHVKNHGQVKPDQTLPQPKPIQQPQQIKPIVQPQQPVKVEVNPVEPVQPQVDHKDDGDLIVDCPICGKHLPQKEIEKHLDQHLMDDKKFECPFCFQDMKNAKDLQKHVASVHKE
ncbi:hypothetical protein EIN_095780 [Entamoeba invadens IP1]|uniref:UBZ4-type domain-containing protein n=2 Tax=Entamoeba invadens TaxID=33085 RepID=A0A0A1U655_ENTIV|nr:hypothetical protein EIN_095780 [Entamoeba invadens IP1]ELP87321.1 hypothetical protein EIN_095780 [Entamoeba invadens IP1]BAN41364.1 hypothetical protein [Entamoeba invadens]BAN42398.1 hypothetical protein [Entamoeba invadens]|eukprot:XP_004254092.1 hypothetical protein EIN_095780 [Entamoeba invadens IP1]